MQESGTRHRQQVTRPARGGGHVAVTAVETSESVLRCEFQATGRVARYLTGDPLRVDYGHAVDDVAESLLVAPALAQVCPVAWATGASVAVERIDPEFLVALHEVRQALCRLYPSFMQGGPIQYDETDCPGPCDEGWSSGRSESHALLFAGGVDSLASYVRLRALSPTLVYVLPWGVDGETWAQTTARLSSFARQHGRAAVFVQTNARSILDTTLLNATFGSALDGDWYRAVGSGLGLLGLCGPLCAVRGIDRLAIAGTHTRPPDEPWGSHPAVDDEVRWSGTTCRHDGADRGGQETYERLAAFARTVDPSVTVWACPNAPAEGWNCSRCEPCARAIVGLVAAGCDPRDHGFVVTEETFSTIRDSLQSGVWELGPEERVAWHALQTGAEPEVPTAVPGTDGFFEWLHDADIETLVARATPSLRTRLCRDIPRRAPYPLYRSLAPVYRRVRDIVS